jgi:hypothetical protein
LLNTLSAFWSIDFFSVQNHYRLTTTPDGARQPEFPP